MKPNIAAVRARAEWMRYVGYRFLAAMACQAIGLPMMPGLLADAGKGIIDPLPFFLATILVVVATVAVAQMIVAFRHGPSSIEPVVEQEASK